MAEWTTFVPRRGDLYRPWKGVMVTVTPKSRFITRIFQAAGDHCKEPGLRSYRDGFCLRLPRSHMLIVVRLSTAGVPAHRPA